MQDQISTQLFIIIYSIYLNTIVIKHLKNKYKSHFEKISLLPQLHESTVTQLNFSDSCPKHIGLSTSKTWTKRVLFLSKVKTSYADNKNTVVRDYYTYTFLQ